MDWPTPTLADVFKARRAIAPYLSATPALEPRGLLKHWGAAQSSSVRISTRPVRSRCAAASTSSLRSSPKCGRGEWWLRRRETMVNRLPTPRGSSVPRRPFSCPKPQIRSRSARPWPLGLMSSRSAVTLMRHGWRPRNMQRGWVCATFTRRTSRSLSPGLARPLSNCWRPLPTST